MRVRFRALAQAALPALIVAGGQMMAGPAPAQDDLRPLVAATRFGDGPDGDVFQCLLGATTAGGALVSYEQAGPRLSGRQPVRWVGLDGAHGSATANRPTPHDEPCDWVSTVDAVPEPAEVGSYVGIPGAWPVMPTVLRLHSPQSETYRDAAGDYFRLIAHKTESVTLTQVIRTDLEGDGIEEVLLTVTDSADAFPTTADPGDHSAILLRRVTAGGGVETILVDGEFHAEREDFAAAVEFRIIAIADVNGDGAMEIIAGVDYYEGISFAVYQFVGDRAQIVLTCGCGA